MQHKVPLGPLVRGAAGADGAHKLAELGQQRPQRAPLLEQKAHNREARVVPQLAERECVLLLALLALKLLQHAQLLLLGLVIRARVGRWRRRRAAALRVSREVAPLPDEVVEGKGLVQVARIALS